MENRQNLSIFVETENGLEYFDMVFVEGQFYGVWDDGNDYMDDINTLDDFIDEYSDTFYESTEDFKNGNQKSIIEWAMIIQDNYEALL